MQLNMVYQYQDKIGPMLTEKLCWYVCRIGVSQILWITLWLVLLGLLIVHDSWMYIESICLVALGLCIWYMISECFGYKSTSKPLFTPRDAFWNYIMLSLPCYLYTLLDVNENVCTFWFYKIDIYEWNKYLQFLSVFAIHPLLGVYLNW